MQSAPKSAGRARPTIALKLAPSMKRNAPAAWSASARSWIPLSKSPRVLGFVTMAAAVFGPIRARMASRSRSPSFLEGTGTGVRPHIVTVAGFVPWAVSGMRTSSLPGAWSRW